jgi:hypothetical protein
VIAPTGPERGAFAKVKVGRKEEIRSLLAGDSGCGRSITGVSTVRFRSVSVPETGPRQVVPE